MSRELSPPLADLLPSSTPLLPMKRFSRRSNPTLPFRRVSRDDIFFVIPQIGSVDMRPIFADSIKMVNSSYVDSSLNFVHPNLLPQNR